MKAKSFPLAAVLSIASGKLLCPYSEARAVLMYMTGNNLHYQFARALERCRPWLLHWFPALSLVQLGTLDTLIQEQGYKAGTQAFLAGVRAAGYPATYDIAPIPPQPPPEEPPHVA